MSAKPVQISVETELLERIDRDPEARAKGRSAFIRSAVEDLSRGKRTARDRGATREGLWRPGRRHARGGRRAPERSSMAERVNRGEIWLLARKGPTLICDSQGEPLLCFATHLSASPDGTLDIDAALVHDIAIAFADAFRVEPHAAWRWPSALHHANAVDAGGERGRR